MTTLKPSDIPLKADESIDEFMHGRLRLIQPRRGYRFSIDALLLARFVTIKAGDRVVDLGTGCGIIPLLLLLSRPLSHVLGLEIQPDLAGQAFRNASLNGVAGRMSVVIADVKNAPLPPLSTDVVVCNPPYRKFASGRINPNPQKAIARHEILLVLDDILNTARRILKAGGRIALIYPAVRAVDLIVRMRSCGIEPKRIRFIHPNGETESVLVLVEGTAGGRAGIKVLPPLLNPGEMPSLT
ncbi:MAG: methyltransferase domain-containing protein [Desulfobacteraceae bacterium]|nr:MAG: methyltransferase domain-containing protein [Desulfobacteraceae bacterium]